MTAPAASNGKAPHVGLLYWLLLAARRHAREQQTEPEPPAKPRFSPRLSALLERVQEAEEWCAERRDRHAAEALTGDPDGFHASCVEFYADGALRWRECRAGLEAIIFDAQAGA